MFKFLIASSLLFASMSFTAHADIVESNASRYLFDLYGTAGGDQSIDAMWQLVKVSDTIDLLPYFGPEEGSTPDYNFYYETFPFLMSYYFDEDYLFGHPKNADDELPALAFLAPSTGLYTFDTTFYQITANTNGGNVDASVVLDGSTLGGATIDFNDPNFNSTYIYADTLELTKGQVLLFQVGRSTDNHTSDSFRIYANVSFEDGTVSIANVPLTGSLATLGLALLGASVVRKRNKK